MQIVEDIDSAPKKERRKSRSGRHSNRTLTPEQIKRRTLRQTISQQDNEIEATMHKFVREMANIEERLTKEKQQNEELTDNYNELLDVLVYHTILLIARF